MPHIFAPAAELLLAGLKPVAARTRVLGLEPGAPVLHHALSRSPALQPAQRLFLDPALGAVREASSSSGLQRVCGDAWFLPYRDASIDLVLANLLLGDVDLDVAVLRELRRVLRPGGQLVATTLLAGTLEEFFDITQEVCEQQGLVASRAVLADERSAQYDPGSLQRALAGQGFTQVQVGVENRAAPFADGHQFVQDPVVQNVFLSDWLRSLADPRVRASALAGIASAIDTYFLGIGFTARLVTGVVTALQP